MVAIVTVVEVDTPGISLDVLAEAITRGRPDNGALLLAHSTPGVPAQPARWRIRHTAPRALPPQPPNHHQSPRSGPDRGANESPVIADPALPCAAAVQRLTADQPPAPASEETGQ